MYKRKNLSILIIDDDENVSTILKEYLQLRGHEIDIVNEGSRGITKNSIKKYDIVFIDYHLDNDIPPLIDRTKINDDNILNGALVSEIIKSDNTLIFGYTGDSTKNAINKFKTSGVDGILFKPIEPELINKLMLNIETNYNFDKNYISKAFRSQRNILIFN
jgi:CheY-like chemotaxis protein